VGGELRNQDLRVFVGEIARGSGAGFESTPCGSRIVLTGIYKSVLTRILAAAIIVLVVSPYSEPFATITGTDFSGAGAVDVGDGSKFKSSTQDAIAATPLTVVVVELFVPLEQPIVAPAVPVARSHQRLILRL
jgi:hypothetical protein